MSRLKELRQEKNLSQQTLGKKIGVSYRTIQNWENGVNSIKPDKAQKLADFFGVSVGYLLGYDAESSAIAPSDKIALDDIEKRVMTFDGKPLTEEDKLAIKTIIEVYLGKKGGD